MFAPLLRIACLLAVSLPAFAMRPPTPEELAALPLVPERLPAGVLAPENHPRLLSRADLERGRANVERAPWAAAYLQKQKALCDRFAAMDEAALRALVPPRGSLFVVGLGMNLDPIHAKRMLWVGWEEDPFRVRASDGTLYPNEAWPDSGSGFRDPKSGERYYFRAIANAAVCVALEREVLPALADVYALTGSQAHAQAAAVLLDALADAYPASVRGPLDYPMSKELRRYGGRLDRATQQVARGVASYAQVADLVAPSGELEKPSHYESGATRREAVGRNLLWDGALYCLLYARQLEGLGNGMADFNYGAAVAGLLLEEPRFCEPLLTGPRSLRTMLENNLIRQRFYFETSPGYEFFTLALYLRSAELVEHLRERGWAKEPSFYTHRGALNYFTAPYASREVGGHIPLLGNTRVDTETVPSADGTQARFQREGVLSTWHVLARAKGVAAETAREWLRQEGGAVEEERWLVFHYDEAKLQAEPGERPAPPARGPLFDGGKGLALLRGGSGQGLALFFGPAQTKSQHEALTWTAFAHGAEWSYDPGRFNAHFRFGWCASSVAHQSLVVDRQDAPMSDGTGHLLAFGGDAAAQWALASHPGAYRDLGVTRFERLLAQVQEKPGGELLYWLDIGAVEGGQRREESFHTQMQKVAFTPQPGWQPAGVALHGEADLGRRVLGDYTLKGRKEGFYWTPPGAGYGFLGSPQSARQEGALRAIWKAPAFYKGAAQELVADFPPGLPGRELVLAEGPQAVGHPAVPYLLRGDATPGGSSLFAKVLHFTDAQGPRIQSVSNIPLSGGDALCGAWLVERRDGARDLWVFNSKAGQPLHATPPGLPPVETDGRLTLARYNAEGEPIAATAEGATRLRVGEAERTGPGEARGRLRRIQETTQGLELEVEWEGATPEGSTGLANLTPAVGQPSSWSVRSVKGARLALEDASDSLGGGEATVDAEGWATFRHELSRLLTPGGVNTRFAEGKPVYTAEGRLAGRVAQVRDGATALRLDGPAPESGRLTLREMAVGDQVALPQRLVWQP